MTGTEINAAIAEACGWTDIHDDPTWGWLGNPPDLQGSKWPLLRYTECLNAMHEAEEVLCASHLHKDYALILGRMVKRRIRFDAIHATAQQRAEAFLVTIGKWQQ